MIELLTGQAESDRLFDRWAKQLIGGSSEFDRGWVIEGSGTAFSNYGDGVRGTIRDSVMLGLDTALGHGVVKIVRPLVARQDRGKLTAIGRDDDGRKLLLRQGWLKKNPPLEGPPGGLRAVDGPGAGGDDAGSQSAPRLVPRR